LTKHIASDEAYPKLHVSLEDVDKLIAQNVKLGSSSRGLGICEADVDGVKNMHKLTAKHAPKLTIRTRLEKIMHKLYDLEPDSAPEKPLKADLRAELYQMENY
jgi:hypothetical protein